MPYKHGRPVIDLSPWFRIATAFGYGAVTMGVSFEKPATRIYTATPGTCHNLALIGRPQKQAL